MLADKGQLHIFEETEMSMELFTDKPSVEYINPEENTVEGLRIPQIDPPCEVCANECSKGQMDRCHNLYQKRYELWAKAHKEKNNN